MEQIDIRLGDCLIELPKIPDNSIDMVLIDPPYFTSTSKNPIGGKKKNKNPPIAILIDSSAKAIQVAKERLGV